MANKITWKDPNGDASKLVGYVGLDKNEATNEAFILEGTRLESKITGKEGSYDVADTAGGKAKAELLLDENNIPEKTTTIN